MATLLEEIMNDQSPTATSTADLPSGVEYLDGVLAQENEEAKKATMTEVVRSGGLRAQAGFVQSITSMLEGAKLIPEGSTRDYTMKILQAEKMGDMSIAQTLTRDTIAQIIPLAAEYFATRGVPLKTALGRSAAIGGTGGFFTFIEDPNAATGAGARMFNTALGSTLGPMLMAGAVGAGRTIDAIRGARGPLSAAGPDIRPGLETRREGAEMIEAAAEEGITLTPGQATADPALVAQEFAVNAPLSSASKRFVADTMNSNATSLEGLIDELVDAIIPEGKKVIADRVSQLYAKADGEIIQKTLLPRLEQLRLDPTIENTISRIKKNPSLQDLYDGHAPNSIGRVHMILDNLQSQIDNAADKDLKKVLIAAKDRLVALADEASPNFEAARATSQRQKTAMQVEETLKATGGSTMVPNVDQATRFVSGFQNLEAKEQLNFAINNLKTEAMRKEAKAKFQLLLELIPRVSKQQDYLDNLLKQSGGAFSERTSQLGAAFYSVVNFLNQNNDRKFIEFILDPSKSAARLREIMPRRNTLTEENLKAIGIWVEENINDYDQVFGLEAQNFVTPRDNNNLSQAGTQVKSQGFPETYGIRKPRKIQG